MDDEQRLFALIRADREVMELLRLARALALPDWALAAGVIRARVWDHLTGRKTPLALNDVDVIFFDAQDTSKAREAAIEAELAKARPDLDWQVRNQARMHLGRGVAPYLSTLDAMCDWLEVPTAVGLRLEADESFTLLAPFGLADLFALILRPTLAGKAKIDLYRERLAQKPWQKLWPELQLFE